MGQESVFKFRASEFAFGLAALAGSTASTATVRPSGSPGGPGVVRIGTSGRCARVGTRRIRRAAGKLCF
jgi:hypothetical protein